MEINQTGKELYLKKITVDDITEDVLAWFNDKNLMKFYTNSKKQITREALLSSIVNGEKNEVSSKSLGVNENCLESDDAIDIARS